MSHDPAGLANALAHWVAPFDYQYLGASGATLLFDLFRCLDREFVLLPAFTCHGLSAAAHRAGKTLVHIDSKPGELNADDALICRWLEEQEPRRCILLVDSAFGLPFPAVQAIRRRFPGLYIIEDCVRALGSSAHNEPPGTYGDALLLSMYKTICGNDHGAVLLTRHPLRITQGPRHSTSIRQRLATSVVLRHVYEEWRRRQPADLTPPPESLESSSWSPVFGLPSEMCVARFLQELANLEKNLERRKIIYRELASAIGKFARCKLIPQNSGCTASCYYLSFVTEPDVRREEVLCRLHSSALFLLRTWDLIPPAMRCFAGTFPFGWSQARHLAESVVHIPIDSFQSPARRARLIKMMQASLA